MLLNATPVFIFLLSFSEDKNVQVGWRLGIELVVLTLCASISYEFILPVMISFYILNASLIASLHFYQTELALKSNQHFYLKQKISPRFIFKSLKHSFFILLFSLIIYPILPRAPDKFNMSSQFTSEIGYSEEVNTSLWTKRSDKNAGVAFRIYKSTEKSFEDLIPLSLLRVRALDLYHAGVWMPSSIKTHMQLPSPSDVIQKDRLKVIREKSNSEYLAVPYNGMNLVSDTNEAFQELNHTLIKTDLNEWKKDRNINEKIEYTIELNSDLLFSNDIPRKSNLKIDQIEEKEALKNLAISIFENAKTTNEKIKKLRTFFEKNKFRSKLPGEENDDSADHKRSLLMSFLFDSKKGHCELFASSSALLLRFADVPTRLVSGYRMGRFPENNILTVRTSDAHAWIEYYNENKNWVPMDFTPKDLWEVGLKEWFMDQYDYLSGKWYEYLFNSSESSAEELKKISRLLLDIGSFSLLNKFYILFFSSLVLIYFYLKNNPLNFFLLNLSFLEWEKKCLFLFFKKRVLIYFNETLWESLRSEYLYSKKSKNEKKMILKKMKQVLFNQMTKT